jgi:hypothetical protein
MMNGGTRRFVQFPELLSSRVLFRVFRNRKPVRAINLVCETLFQRDWRRIPILFVYAKQLCHFPILETFSGNVGLHPCAIDNELGNGALACALYYFLCGSGHLFNIDFLVGNVVLGKPALCDMAIAAPRGSVNSHLHSSW